MNSLKLALAAGLLLVGLAGCSTGPRIVTNRDPNTDLAQFRTFDFYSPLGTDRQGAQTLLSQHLIAATTAELEARGLRRDTTNPELRINFFVSTREVVSSTPSSVSFRTGRYHPWGGYSIGTSTSRITQSTDGTLAMDMVNVRTNQLVWESAATDQVTSSSQRNLESTVRRAVTDMLAEFP